VTLHVDISLCSSTAPRTERRASLGNSHKRRPSSKSMETSSPLAAIRPSAPSFGQRDLFVPHAHATSHLAASPLMSSTLNLREHFNLQRSHPDFLNVKSVRGSSPTASLAADLSQNFNIADARLVLGSLNYKHVLLLTCNSPGFPTPRRALFTTATMIDAMHCRRKSSL
jgi:M-phase inducer tyrosine phosphatase